MEHDLTRINLNLIMALDALLKEKQVTNAGKRLHITQSAMSNCLKQLREIFNDELFIRGQASRLIPTSFALSLEPRVTEAIEKLTNIFHSPEVFNPKDARVTFVLGLSDYFAYLFLPHLVKRILSEAPRISLVIKQLTFIKNTTVFENDDVDMAIGIFRSVPELLIAQPLFTEKLVCIGAIDNPRLQKPIDKTDFIKAKHFVVKYPETRAEMIIESAGYERRAVVTVNDAIPGINAIIDTDLISVVFERLGKTYCSQNTKLGIQNFNFELPTATANMVWHPKQKNNPAHRWFRELIIDIGKGL